jgi:hypothetical protein
LIILVVLHPFGEAPQTRATNGGRRFLPTPLEPGFLRNKDALLSRMPQNRLGNDHDLKGAAEDNRRVRLRLVPVGAGTDSLEREREWYIR